MKFAGWAAPDEGSGYWRVAQPLAALRERFALDAPVGPRLELLGLEPGDVVVGQRIASDEMQPLWELLRRSGCRLVIDVDDDHWHPDPRNPTGRGFWTPKRLALFERNLADAELVTVTNEQLAAIVGRWNEHVAVLPNFIDAALLEHERPRRDRVVVGWAGGASHAADLAVAAPALRQVLARHPEAELHLVGHDFREVIGIPARVTAWNRSIPAYQRALDFDIALAPLSAHPFNLGKSHLKALEYGALGMPVIASAVGPYPAYVDHGETGMLAATAADWVEQLELLLCDPELRVRMGVAGRRKAAGHTMQGNAHRWLLAYGPLVG